MSKDGVISRNPSLETPPGVFSEGLRNTKNDNPTGRKSGF
jgi:hypothetical protein